MVCMEFPYLQICADAAKILEANTDEQSGERYVPVLASVLVRIEQGKQELSLMIEALVQELSAQQQASKDELAKVEAAVRMRFEQFQVMAEGIQQLWKAMALETMEEA
jgi:hypothetical protein